MAISAVSGSSSYDASTTAATANSTQAPPPPRGAKPAGGAPPAGGAAKTSSTEESSSSSSSSTKIYDVKDADKDGTVTYKEEIAYALSHPEEVQQDAKAQAQANAQYDQTGKTTAPTGLQSMLNAYA